MLLVVEVETESHRHLQVAVAETLLHQAVVESAADWEEVVEESSWDPPVYGMYVVQSNGPTTRFVVDQVFLLDDDEACATWKAITSVGKYSR